MEEASKYIIYLDANNLYGWAMSQPLPTGGLKWSPSENLSCDNLKEHIQKYIDGKRGAFLEVDLEYPKQLHDLHDELPLAVEKVRVTEDMLFPTVRK